MNTGILKYVRYQRDIDTCFFHMLSREKGRDLTQSYDKNPYTHGKTKNDVVDIVIT